MKDNKKNNKTNEDEIEKEENNYIENSNNNGNKNEIIGFNGKNNIIEINHELNGKENYEGKDILFINNIMKEDNIKDENNIISKQININNNKNYVDYSIDELKKRKIKIQELFNDLCKNIIGSKEMEDLQINAIYSKEILIKINNPGLRKILLMDEESSKKFMAIINYKKLNEFVNSDDKKKDYLIEKNREEFNKIYNILSGKIELLNEIKLINEYKNCKKIMDMNKKFQLFGKNKIKNFNKEKKDFIYYFTFKNNSYFFFSKEMKIAKLRKILYYLI